jgi:hypothetical protein
MVMMKSCYYTDAGDTTDSGETELPSLVTVMASVAVAALTAAGGCAQQRRPRSG